MKNRLSLSAVLIIAVLFSALLFLLVRYHISPFVFQVPKNLVYSADLISLDNFYDEQEQKFTGDQRSVSTFSYNVDETKGNSSRLINLFDIRTIDGEPIISVRREYNIDRLKWLQTSSETNTDFNVYIFGPRNPSKAESFYYRHVNYDQDLIMTFEAVENIGGIETYRYSTSFGADQTKNLSHLPGVPETRGINLDGSLRLWIEPVSGWLVKYQDSAVAYYYDQETGKRISPWNKFGNSYSRNSVLKNAQIAKTFKNSILLFHFVVPILFTAILAAFALFNLDHKRAGSAVLILAIFYSVIFYTAITFIDKKSEEINIGISRWVPEGNIVYDQNIQGFKDALTLAGYVEGRDIEYHILTANSDDLVQREVAKSFARADIDLVYSLTTPGTLVLKELITNRPIVFSLVTYPVEAGMIDSLKNSGNNLVGTRNWVPLEDQLSVFLEIMPETRSIGFIHRSGEANSAIQLEEMRQVTGNLGIDVIDLSASNLESLSTVLNDSLGRIDALYSACDTLVQGEAEGTIIAFAHTHKIPSFSCNNSGPIKGDLVGTVTDFYQLGKLSGEKAALILEGASPTSLQTNTVARPFVYVNQVFADKLGISIPQNIMAEADLVIRE